MIWPPFRKEYCQKHFVEWKVYFLFCLTLLNSVAKDWIWNKSSLVYVTAWRFQKDKHVMLFNVFSKLNSDDLTLYVARTPSVIIVTSQWTQWRLKSPALRLFTQPFIQTKIKEIIKVPRHWPLGREFTGDRWIPRTNGQLRGKCFHLMTSSW